MRIYKGTVLRFAPAQPTTVSNPIVVAGSLSSAARILERTYPQPEWEVHEVSMAGEIVAIEQPNERSPSVPPSASYSTGGE